MVNSFALSLDIARVNQFCCALFFLVTHNKVVLPHAV
jgi:hypothetical protein